MTKEEIKKLINRATLERKAIDEGLNQMKIEIAVDGRKYAYTAKDKGEYWEVHLSDNGTPPIHISSPIFDDGVYSAILFREDCAKHFYNYQKLCPAKAMNEIDEHLDRLIGDLGAERLSYLLAGL